MRDLIINLLREAGVPLQKEEIEKLLETPPSSELGDYAFPCFALVKIQKSSPEKIAEYYASKMKPQKQIEKITNKGAYINFFLKRKELAKSLIEEIKKEKESFGKNKLGNKNKTMVEFPSPNTNKPLHLGHLRNMTIGESVSRILEFCGEKVIRANLNNDRGVHICKSMLAYKKWGNNQIPGPELKPDHLIGDFYVLFSKKAKENPELEQEAQEMLLKWEKGDKETIALWKKMNSWALEGFKQTFKTFGIKHDKEYFESELYKKGKEIILEGVKKGVFIKEQDGAVYADLSKENLGKKYLLRADGTSIYITQDLYLAKLKFDEFKINKSVYVVANEQEYHFKVLFELLNKLSLLKKANLYHLSYGMVNLPEGRMKSREGSVVDADDLIFEVQKLVKKELENRTKISKKELEEKSLIIALSAIKYLLLKVSIKKDITFNPKESISFEGNTGPYLLYSYARACSILKKVKLPKNYEIKEELNKEEQALIIKLSQFKNLVEEAYFNMNPSIIANYSYELSQVFNEFYNNCPVINSQNKDFRLNLVFSFKQVLGNALYLLGIETLDEM